jgi:two-component system OmpR family response regulator
MSEPNIARPRVLVADPDPETSALLARSLQWAGYEVTTAANGREALDLTNRLRPAAAVLEIKMELLNGYEVVRTLREGGQRLPIVMISARAGKLDRDFAFTVGADDYVKKPFHSSELVARLGLLVPVPNKAVQPDAPEPQPFARPAGPSRVARTPYRQLRPVPALATR